MTTSFQQELQWLEKTVPPHPYEKQEQALLEKINKLVKRPYELIKLLRYYKGKPGAKENRVMQWFISADMFKPSYLNIKL